MIVVAALRVVVRTCRRCAAQGAMPLAQNLSQECNRAERYAWAQSSHTCFAHLMLRPSDLTKTSTPWIEMTQNRRLPARG